LIEAGFDWLAWRGRETNIVMDGFIITRLQVTTDAKPTNDLPTAGLADQTETIP
jgi:hypothetical protein